MTVEAKSAKHNVVLRNKNGFKNNLICMDEDDGIRKRKLFVNLNVNFPQIINKENLRLEFTFHLRQIHVKP